MKKQTKKKTRVAKGAEVITYEEVVQRYKMKEQ